MLLCVSPYQALGLIKGGGRFGAQPTCASELCPHRRGQQDHGCSATFTALKPHRQCSYTKTMYSEEKPARAFPTQLPAAYPRRPPPAPPGSARTPLRAGTPSPPLPAAGREEPGRGKLPPPRRQAKGSRGRPRTPRGRSQLPGRRQLPWAERGPLREGSAEPAGDRASPRPGSPRSSSAPSCPSSWRCG